MNNKMIISKSSTVSIGLGLILLIGSFYFGGSYKEIKTRLDFLEKRLDKIEQTLILINDKL